MTPYILKGSQLPLLRCAETLALPHICYVLIFILAQTGQTVNGYKQYYYGLKSIALMHSVRYYRYAPV